MARCSDRIRSVVQSTLKVSANVSNVSFLGNSFLTNHMWSVLFSSTSDKLQKLSSLLSSLSEIHYIPHNLNFLWTRQYLPQSRFSVFSVLKPFYKKLLLLQSYNASTTFIYQHQKFFSLYFDTCSYQRRRAECCHNASFLKPHFSCNLPNFHNKNDNWMQRLWCIEIIIIPISTLTPFLNEKSTAGCCNYLSFFLTAQNLKLFG